MIQNFAYLYFNSDQKGYYFNTYVENCIIVLIYQSSLLYFAQCRIEYPRRNSSFSFVYIPKP